MSISNGTGQWPETLAVEDPIESHPEFCQEWIVKYSEYVSTFPNWMLVVGLAWLTTWVCLEIGCPLTIILTLKGQSDVHGGVRSSQPADGIRMAGLHLP